MRLIKINILIIVITTIIFSCSKDEINFEGTETLNEYSLKNNHSEYQGLYDKILSIDDLTEQKIVVSTFNSGTQAILWKMKLNNFVINNKLDEKQLDFIQRLNTLLTPENISDITKRENKDLIIIFDNYKHEAIELFEEHIGWYLLNKFENINQTLNKIDSSSNNSLNNASTKNIIKPCNCQEMDECWRITGVSIWGIQWEYGSCDSEDCYVQDYWVWQSDNTGRCHY